MKQLLFIVFLLILNLGFSQKILDIHYHSLFGKDKSFQIFNNSKLDYKLKGDLIYRTHKLVNMNDSMLIFDNDYVAKISQLKAIKIKGAKICPWIFTVGALFFLIDTGNNIANGRTTVVTEQAVLVASICLVSGIIVKRIQDKHVYIRKNVTLRVIDTDYQNLNKH